MVGVAHGTRTPARSEKPLRQGVASSIATNGVQSTNQEEDVKNGGRQHAGWRRSHSGTAPLLEPGRGWGIVDFFAGARCTGARGWWPGRGGAWQQ